MMPQAKWTHSATRFISPFKTAEGSLDGCMMRVAKQATFSTDQFYDADEEGFDANFAPELKFVVDSKAVSDSCGLAADQLTLAVTIRDRTLGRFEKVAEWLLPDLPLFHEIERESLRDFSSPTRMDISVVLSPLSDLKGVDTNLASKRGHLIAERVVKIRRSVQALDFPRVWRSPEDFKKAGLSERSLWAVRWKSYEVDLPMPDVIEVWFNEAFKNKFAFLAVDDSFANLFKRQLSASILAEIAYGVLGIAAENGAVPTDDDGILSVLGTRF